MDKKYLFFILMVFALIERTIIDLGPNLELITLASIATYVFYGTKVSMFFTLAIIMVSDLIIGNSNIFIFTWTGFLTPVLFLWIIPFKNKILSGTLAAVSFNLFFYFWTNFGVWYLDSWGMYSNDFSGLINSYINGLPFLKLHVLNTLITIPFGIWLIEKASRFTVPRFYHLSPVDNSLNVQS